MTMNQTLILMAIALVMSACASPITTHTIECAKRGPSRPLTAFGHPGCLGDGFHAVMTGTVAQCQAIARRWYAVGQLTVNECPRSRVAVREWAMIE